MKVEYEPLIVLPGIGADVRENFRKCGYETVDDVREASTEELMKVPGVGQRKAEFLTEYLQ